MTYGQLGAPRVAIRRKNPTRWQTSRIYRSGYTGSEHLVLLRSPDHDLTGATPLVYLHNHGGGARAVMATGAIRYLRAVADAGVPVILADYGGPATWANNTVVDVGGRIDQALTYCANEFGTATNRVVAAGEGMGAWAAAAWAWRNRRRLQALWLVAPIVDVLAFYNTNPDLQASIDAAYGGHPNLLAALPAHDPAQALNRAALRPLAAERIRIDYAAGDQRVPPADVVAWAADVGVTGRNVVGHPGGHSTLHLAVNPAEIASWVTERVHGSWYR